MTTRRSIARFAFPGLLLAGLAVILALILGPAMPGTAVRLADGRVFTLEAATFGTNHYGPPRSWNRLLAGLPASWTSRLGVERKWILGLDRERLVLWTQDRPNPTGPPGISPPAQPYWTNSSLVDEQGFETPLRPELMRMAWRARRAARPALALVFGTSVFPRRSRELVLRLYHPSESGGPAFDGELRAPNPTFRMSYPQWSAEPLPGVRRFSELEFALRDLTVLIPEPPKRGVPAQAQTRFAVRRNGTPCADWQVERIDLSEATGNVVTLRADSEAPELHRATAGDEELCRFTWPLWSDEPAWKLRVEFVPKPEARLSPSELCTVRNIAVPPRDGITPIGITVRPAEVEVRLLALVGEHASLPGREHDVQGQTTLEVEVGPVPSSHRFAVVRVRDEQGRLCRPAMTSANRSFGFEISADARSVDVSVAVFRRPIFDFVVRPVFRTE